jgi:hypothetical protein
VKDLALKDFKIDKSFLEMQCGKKIKHLRINNGGEYLNKAFQGFLPRKG